MKKKFLTVFSIVFVLALAAAVYAFNQSTVFGETIVATGAKTDNCPLKNKNAQTVAAENHSSHSCCDNANCCCKSGACPMKSSSEKGSADCCGNCCGGSCPMKNEQAETSAIGQAKAESCPHSQTAGS